MRTEETKRNDMHLSLDTEKSYTVESYAAD